MNTHHTPGPWKATLTSKYVPVVQDSTGKNVCQFDWRDLPRRTADARLISAAPDLIAALRALTAVVESYEYGRPWPGRPHAQMDAARAAIAKASGANGSESSDISDDELDELIRDSAED